MNKNEKNHTTINVKIFNWFDFQKIESSVLCCAEKMYLWKTKIYYFFIYGTILKTNSVKCYKSSYWLLKISTIKYQISTPLNRDERIIRNIGRIKVYTFFVKTHSKFALSFKVQTMYKQIGLAIYCKEITWKQLILK